MLVIRDGCVREHMIHQGEQENKSLSLYVRLLEVSEDTVAFFEGHDKVLDLSRAEDAVYIAFKGEESDVPEFIKQALNSGISALGFEVKKKSLQKVYMDLAHEDSMKKGYDENGGRVQ